jgi:cellobiose phosphorylase
MRNCPASLESASDIHRAEPYVYSQTIAGRSAQKYGEAKNSWLTGTAAWSFVAASQGILGIIPDYDGLIIRPCLPSGIRRYTAKRMFRGAMYTITVINNGGDRIRMCVDGEPAAGCLIPHEPGRLSCEVTVVLD